MKLRHIESGQMAHSSRFNLSSVSEIIVGFEDGEQTSDYMRNYEVLLDEGKPTERWWPMIEAFSAGDLITDNYNTIFFEPRTPEDRIRGYSH